MAGKIMTIEEVLTSDTITKLKSLSLDIACEETSYFGLPKKGKYFVMYCKAKEERILSDAYDHVLGLLQKEPNAVSFDFSFPSQSELRNAVTLYYREMSDDELRDMCNYRRLALEGVDIEFYREDL